MALFGELLAELRRDKKMTQKELSAVLHVSVGTISNYEKSVHFPDVEKLVNLADYFGVTTDYLLGRCENNLSPDVFKVKVIDGKTVGRFIDSIQKLPQEQKRALAVIINDMEFRVIVDQHNERDQT